MKERHGQAARIISKFGGARKLYRALLLLNEPEAVRSPSTIYKWAYSRDKDGTGGVIPLAMIPFINKAARFEGVFLTAEDWYPGEK